jgi:hypothetical protein
MVIAVSMYLISELATAVHKQNADSAGHQLSTESRRVLFTYFHLF